MITLYWIILAALARLFCVINASAVRLSLSICVSLAVLASYVQAPFMHTHQHEVTQKHPAPLLHLHLQDAAKTPAIRSLDPDDDVQYENWFAATTGHPGSHALVVAFGDFSAPTLECMGRAAQTPLPISHGPPGVSPPNLRAPPA
jgi:hypothetical protein